MKRIVLFILIICMALSASACSETYSSGKNKSFAEKMSDDFNYAYSLGFYSPKSDIFKSHKLTYDKNLYNSAAISISENGLKGFNDYLSELNTEYKYESYYNLDKALDLYGKVQNKKITHSNELTTLTEDALFNRVKENNAKYKEQLKSQHISEFYNEFTDEELKKVCKHVIASAKVYLDSGHKYAAEVKCILGDLKILEDATTMSNAYVSDDNCLMINANLTEALKIKDPEGKKDVFISVIVHETMHLLQKGCTHRLENVYCIGNSFRFEELEVNPLFCNWFYEGSAEKLLCNITGYTPFTYEFYINYINSLSLSVILNSENKIYDVEETTFEKDLNGLYRVFDCQTQEEKIELHNMLFSLDIVETDNEGFVNAVNPEMTDEELVIIKRNLKNSICETMAKYFYKNLATHIFEEKVTLKDIFYYITVFEQDVNSHIHFTDEEKCKTAEPFIANYTEIQNEFFTLLASETGYDAKQVESMFNDYGLVDSQNNKNFLLSDITKEKQALFAYVLSYTYSPSFKNIRSY